LLRRELEGRSKIEPLAKDRAAKVVASVLARESGWFRARETLELSREEARVLAARGAKRAAELAKLDADETRRFEALVREACERVFEEHARLRSFDGVKLDRRLERDVRRSLDELDVPEAKRAILRDAIDGIVR
jgi:hypothetical protein